jgi:hypothetical protein
MTSSDQPQQSTARRALDQITFWRVALLLLLLLIAVIGLLSYQRAEAAQDEYRAALDQVESIRAVAAGDDVLMLSREDLLWLNEEFTILEERILRLQEMTHLPLGLDGHIARLPWVEPRYGAAMDTLDLGLMLADAGKTISSIGAETIEALDTTGIRAEPGDEGATWLDVIHHREDELLAALDQIDTAMQAREEIDEDYLPDRIRYRLESIDSVMEQFSEELALVDDLPLAYTLLGAEEPKRYMVLFQNPAELRPTGGFPGTIAIVEIHRGQITEYEFFDIYLLASDYQDRRTDPIDAPWAIYEFIRPDGLHVQDATWWPDFSTTANVLMEMYGIAGWPEINGILAVQPEVISDLMTITGPITVTVVDELREITPENLLDEAERQRRVQRESGEFELAHKEVIAMIGEELVDQFSASDRGDLIDSVYLMIDAVGRRDMQVYFTDHDAQRFIAERGWDGRLIPDPEIPTMAFSFANITGLKTSLAMQSMIVLDILETDTEGHMEALLTVSLENRGDEQGDPFYEGFQRWWLEVLLPEDASVIGTDPEPAPAPEMMNGGGYVVRIHPGETQQVMIRFTVPQPEEMLIRRQPGLVVPPVTVSAPACEEPATVLFERDLYLTFPDGCPAWTQQPEENSDVD